MIAVLQQLKACAQRLKRSRDYVACCLELSALLVQHSPAEAQQLATEGIRTLVTGETSRYHYLSYC